MPNEHLIIRGGEIYLPFARSRIKALRANGTAYASQKFDIGSATVRVRVAGDHDYIELFDQQNSLDMDSGIVDAGGWMVFDDGTGPGLEAGTFFESTYSKSYNAPFSDTKGNWRYQPSTSSSLVSGRIGLDGEKFKCSVRIDGSESRGFSQRTLPEGEKDFSLPLKKMMARDTPPSIFTGRCRVYVQAMYGLPTIDKGASTGGENSGGIAVVWPESQGRALLLSPKKKTNSSGQANKSIAITTSSGVYLDPKGKHWLFNVSDGSVTVYPLKSSNLGESLRKRLVDGSLGSAEAKHLESAILSRCLPDTGAGETIAIQNVPSSSMGYGWHWNLTGLVSDIVINEMFQQDLAHDAMESTHYRLTMVRLTDDDGNTTGFSANVATMFKSKWAVWRQLWTIVAPLSKGELQKITPRYSTLFPCHGVFYVFYRGDDPVVCSVTVSYKPESVTISESSPPFIGEPGDLLTTGLNNGEYRRRTETARFHAIFSVGDVSRAADGPFNSSETYIDVKKDSSAIVYGGSGSYGELLSGSIPITVVHDGGTAIFPAKAAGPYAHEVYQSSFPITNQAYTENCSNQAALSVCIPHGDSEAAFIQFSKSKISNRINNSIKSNTGFGFYTKTNITDYNVIDPIVGWMASGPEQTTSLYNSYGRRFGDMGGVAVTTIVPDSTTTSGDSTDDFASSLLTSGSNVGSGVLAQLHDDLTDVVDDPLTTLSGVSREFPLVVSDNRITPTNNAGHNGTLNRVFVGWV